MDRNSEITGYTVTFELGNVYSVTQTENRVFIATGLIPRTNYTFQVSPVSDTGSGPSTEVTKETNLSAGTLTPDDQ